MLPSVTSLVLMWLMLVTLCGLLRQMERMLPGVPVRPKPMLPAPVDPESLLRAEEDALAAEIDALDPVNRLREGAREDWSIFTWWIGWRKWIDQPEMCWNGDTVVPVEDVRRVYEEVARERGLNPDWGSLRWKDDIYKESA